MKTRRKRSARPKGLQKAQSIRLHWPVWYDPLSPLGSAVRHVASLSPDFHWVGVYLLRGKKLVLGPFIGEDTEHRVIPVGQGVCGTAVAENADQIVPNVNERKNYLACSAKTCSEMVALIRDGRGSIVGQIDVDSHRINAFSEGLACAVQAVARELGELWPE